MYKTLYPKQSYCNEEKKYNLQIQSSATVKQVKVVMSERKGNRVEESTMENFVIKEEAKESERKKNHNKLREERSHAQFKSTKSN
jgi:hypothetical protein